MAAFLVALIGNALLAADLPNWAAMITNLNLPEHRGTAIGISRLFRAVGHSIGIALAGLLFQRLQHSFSQSDAFAIGLSLFQTSLIFSAACYWPILKTIAKDTTTISNTLKTRATS